MIDFENVMELDLPKSVVNEIVHEKLRYQKVSSPWFLKQQSRDVTLSEFFFFCFAGVLMRQVTNLNDIIEM